MDCARLSDDIILNLCSRAKEWMEYSSRKPWCNVAMGNIYASPGIGCDCGLESLLDDLNDILQKKIKK